MRGNSGSLGGCWLARLNGWPSWSDSSYRHTTLSYRHSARSSTYAIRTSDRIRLISSSRLFCIPSQVTWLTSVGAEMNMSIPFGMQNQRSVFNKFNNSQHSQYIDILNGLRRNTWHHYSCFDNWRGQQQRTVYINVSHFINRWNWIMLTLTVEKLFLRTCSLKSNVKNCFKSK